MSINLLPDVLESTLSSLLVKQTLSSWNVHGGVKCTTVTLRFHSVNGSHVVPSSGFRRKSPCELRRDEQRAKARRLEKQAKELQVTGSDRPTASTPTELSAQLAVSSANQLTEVNNYFENVESSRDESYEDIQQQDNDANYTSDGVSLEQCMLLLSSMHEDMKDINSKVNLCRKDIKSVTENDNEVLGECIDKETTTLMCVDHSSTDNTEESKSYFVENNFGLKENTLTEVCDRWDEEEIANCFSYLSSDDRQGILYSMKETGPFIDTIVHDRRYQTNELVARTKDLVLVLDLNINKLTEYFVISKYSERRWPVRDHLQHLTAWPQCDKTKFCEAIKLLKAYAQVFYSKVSEVSW